MKLDALVWPLPIPWPYPKGWYMSLPQLVPAVRKHRTPTQHPKLSYWTQIIGCSLARMNRQWMHDATKCWKNTLSQAARDQWQAVAITATIENYDGTSKTPNGFELFIVTNRINDFSAQCYPPNPKLIAFWSPLAPPAGWSPPPALTFLSATFYPPQYLELTFAGHIFEFHNYAFYAVISKAPKSGARFPTHYSALQSGSFSYDNGNTITGIYPQFPLFPQTTPSGFWMGFRLLDYATSCPGPWCWAACG